MLALNRWVELSKTYRPCALPHLTPTYRKSSSNGGKSELVFMSSHQSVGQIEPEIWRVLSPNGFAYFLFTSAKIQQFYAQFCTDSQHYLKQTRALAFSRLTATYWSKPLINRKRKVALLCPRDEKSEVIFLQTCVAIERIDPSRDCSLFMSRSPCFLTRHVLIQPTMYLWFSRYD